MDRTRGAPESGQRQAWMAVLAKADLEALEQAWAAISGKPAYRVLRPPQAGLVMVRARAGGTGMRFNLGEMTVSRCAVQTPEGNTGFGYIQGRNLRHAELSAVFDALLQDPARQTALERTVIAPLRAKQETGRQTRMAKAAETRVEFFTLVRGDDT